jgi:hypothetical protein
MILRSVTGGLAAMVMAATLASAQSNLATDMKLEDAGFKMRQANTPEKMARLKSIPPHKFVPHRKNGRRYWVYADPTACRCAFVGDDIAMQAYRDMVNPPRSNLPGVGPGAIGPDRGGINLENEMQTEMNDESGTNFDDIFHPGF